MIEEQMRNPGENPLVSIIVVTYNSAKYVLETLESAKAQTYPNIELIVADDCSGDNTVQVCEDWLENNSKFFKSSTIVVNKTNKGIAGNCNNGLNNSSGEWIKLIAGDDLLLDNSIKYYMEFALRNEFGLFFAYPQILIENPKEDLRKVREESYERTAEFFDLSADDQFTKLLISDILPMNPATIFFRSKFVKELGGFDESFFPEDIPLYLKVTSMGHKLGLMKRKTVLYRIHNSSISFKGKGNGVINLYWFEIIKTIKSPYLTKKLFLQRPLVVWEYYNIIIWKKLTLYLGNNKTIWKSLRLIRLTSPIYLISKIK